MISELDAAAFADYCREQLGIKAKMPKTTAELHELGERALRVASGSHTIFFNTTAVVREFGAAVAQPRQAYAAATWKVEQREVPYVHVTNAVSCAVTLDIMFSHTCKASVELVANYTKIGTRNISWFEYFGPDSPAAYAIVGFANNTLNWWVPEMILSAISSQQGGGTGEMPPPVADREDRIKADIKRDYAIMMISHYMSGVRELEAALLPTAQEWRPYRDENGATITPGADLEEIAQAASLLAKLGWATSVLPRWLVGEGEQAVLFGFPPLAFGLEILRDEAREFDFSLPSPWFPMLPVKK